LRTIRLALLLLRSLGFYFGFILSAIVYGVLVLLITPWISYPKRYWFISRWCVFVLLWLKLCCNIRIELEGREHLPKHAVVVLSNHQSTFEALYLQLIFQPAVTVVKRELLFIPFFGWGLSLLKPISLNRRKQRSAGKQLLDQGRQALANGRHVLMFPEGTRVTGGEQRSLKMGGFHLAVHTQTDIIPIWHNAGESWPARQIIKYPGIIRVKIGRPLAPQAKAQSLLTLYQDWQTNSFKQTAV